MAKATLPVNFRDDIMNSSMGGKRRYNVIHNADGTISLEDATTYDQVGSNFGAGQINATNTAVNASADAGKIIDDINAIKAVTQEGYIAGALALKQVNSDIVNSLKWNRINEFACTGSDIVYFPGCFNEILIQINTPDDEFRTTIITKGDLINEIRIFQCGSSYYDANTFTFINLNVSLTYVQMRNVLMNGVDKKDKAQMAVYYR